MKYAGYVYVDLKLNDCFKISGISQKYVRLGTGDAPNLFFFFFIPGPAPYFSEPLKKRKIHAINLYIIGLPTKDENSETTVKNLYRLFPNTHQIS